MSFTRTKPTNFYTPEELLSQGYVDLGANGIGQRVIVFNTDGLEGGGINLPKYDYVSRDLTNATTETYTFKTGGSGGTTVATLVIVYTDATLGTISTVTKT